MTPPIAPGELSNITSLSAQEGRLLLQELGVPAENLPSQIGSIQDLSYYLEQAKELNTLFNQDILDKFVAGALE